MPQYMVRLTQKFTLLETRHVNESWIAHGDESIAIGLGDDQFPGRESRFPVGQDDSARRSVVESDDRFPPVSVDMLRSHVFHWPRLLEVVWRARPRLAEL
jgi:hypothetical protein